MTEPDATGQPAGSTAAEPAGAVQGAVDPVVAHAVEAPTHHPIEQPAEPADPPTIEPAPEPSVQADGRSHQHLLEPPAQQMVEAPADRVLPRRLEPTDITPVEPVDAATRPAPPLPEPTSVEPAAQQLPDQLTAHASQHLSEPMLLRGVETPVEPVIAPAVQRPGPQPAESRTPDLVRPPASAVAPRPVPHPVPHPHEPPGQHPVPEAVATGRPGGETPQPVPSTVESAQTWGRVSHDGTVYVRTAAGEVAVGSFQAGSHQDALIYYARKFDALAVEVDLLERRVALPEVPADESQSTLKRLREALSTPTCVGDIDGLRGRLDALGPIIAARRGQARAARELARTQAKANRERIVTDAEALAQSVQWKVAGERLRELLDEWKAAPHVDRATEQALWKRFGAARNAFDRHRRQHFAQLTATQSVVKAAKLKIIDEAEELATSTDWGPTAARLRVLMDEWKTTGRVGRSEEEALWQRFRSAQDAFYAARTTEFNERDAGMASHLAAKQGLLVEAEALLPVTDVAAAKAALRRIEEAWEAAGPVPRADLERVEGRLRRVAETIRKAEDTRWKRTNPEALARAQAAVDQLRSVIDKLETDLAKARDRGDARAVEDALEGIAARRTWLVGAEAAVTEFSGG